MADYTKHFLYASIALRFFPKWSKSLVQWVLPPCISLRKDLEVCRKVIKPIIEQRQAEMEAATKSGADVEYAFDQAFTTLKREVDMATAHIALAMVAIHTTADLLMKTLVALVEHPELVEPLRQEVIREISATGLNNTGLARLDLMDSVLKEVQRRNPVANCAYYSPARLDSAWKVVNSNSVSPSRLPKPYRFKRHSPLQRDGNTQGDLVWSRPNSHVGQWILRKW